MSTHPAFPLPGLRSAIVAAAVFLAAMVGPAPAFAAMVDDPPRKAAPAAPKASKAAKAPKIQKISYEQAVGMVKAGKYKQGLAALKSLNMKSDANAQNYMGFASRKLGDTKSAERYYKAALKINPKHRGALEYYGELMVEKGNAEGASRHLASLKAACGSCAEYNDLKKTMQGAGIAVN
jgi:predicted Zn-dependent protease